MNSNNIAIHSAAQIKASINDDEQDQITLRNIKEVMRN